MKVLITHPIPRNGLDGLYARYEVVYPDRRGPYTEDELARLLPDCDAVLACGPMPGKLIDKCTKLRIISNYGAGYDSVDVDAADRHGIYVTNIPDSTTESTAELAFALMLSVMRRVAELNHDMRSEHPENCFGMGRFMGHNLRGATLGIIGMGRIGRRLAEMAGAFGMNIVYHNRRKLDAVLEHGARYLPMDEMISVADIISINCPLTEETRYIVGRREISRMKKSAVIINTSRGGTLDCDALCDALESGAILGAGLDVYPDEPHVPERLLALPSVTLTPHTGTNTFETRKAMAQAAADRIIDVLSGRIPNNIVNRIPIENH